MWTVYNLVLIWFWLSLSDQVRSSPALQETFQEIFRNYDKNIRPFFGERPVEVSVSAHILSITKVDTANQEFTVDFYFRQTWTDQRLNFSPKPKVQNITLEGAMIQKLWAPDTFFVNEVTSSFHSTTVTNELARLKSNGDVTKSMRLTVTATCPQKLREFPFDSPVCVLHIESFSSPVQDIRYEWARTKPSVTFSDEVTIGDFSFAMFRLRHNSVPALAPVVGSYSRLTLEVQLRRHLGRYSAEFYNPCFLIVLLAISSFWFGSPKLSASLAILSLIALLVVDSNQVSQLKLPKWAEKTWLDCYLRLSITFIVFVIFVNLLELNIPEATTTTAENGPDEEVRLKEDVESTRDTRLASVSAEDAKLCGNRGANRNRPLETRELNPIGQLIVIKSKLQVLQLQFFSYARLVQPYVRWATLGLFLLSDLIYWKSTPAFKPMTDSGSYSI